MNRYWVCILIIVMGTSILTSPVSAEERFTDNGDGTITDHQLGVMWSKTDNQGDIDWNSANQWVQYTFPFTLSTRYDDWRLPTLEEAMSLFVRDENYKGYETDCGQNVKVVPQLMLTCGWIWTSESRSITAPVYNFNRGYHYTDRKVHYRAYRALPVRTIK